MLHFTEAVPGQAGGHDNWQMVWNLWWVRYALEHGQNPFHTDLMFWPGGTDLYLHALNIFNGLLSLPIQYIFGWGDTGARGAMAGYNFIVLWSLVVGAYGARLLARWLWQSELAALLAGLAFGFSTYEFDHLLGHLNLISAEFIPFYILFFLKTLSARNAWLKPAALSVLFLIFNTFLELQYVLYLAIFSSLCLLYLTGWQLWHRRKLGWRNFLAQTWLRALVIAIAFALVTLPFSLNALHSALTNPNTVPPHQDEIYSADLLAYLLPSPFQPLWSNAVQPLIRPFTAPLIEKIVFPGYIVWLLILAGLGFGLWQKVSPKKISVNSGETFKESEANKSADLSYKTFGVFFWLIVAGLFILLSFGRRLHIDGVEHGPTLPAALIYQLPILNITRVPARFAVIGLLALALLATWGLSCFVRLIKNATGRTALTIAMLLLLGFELWPAPYPYSIYNVSQFYQTLAADSAQNYAVLDIPLNTGPFQYETSYLEAQMTHHKPLLGGYISRNPVYQPFLGLPVFNEWRTFVSAPQPDILSPQPPNLDILRYFKVRYVIIHKNLLSDKQQAAAFSFATKLFPSGPIYNQADIVVYQVPALPLPPTLFFDYVEAQGWYQAEKGPDGSMTRWLAGNAANLKFWSINQAKTIQLQIPLWSFQHPHLVEFDLNNQKIAQQEITTTPQSLNLTLPLQPGENTLTLKVSGAAISPQQLGLSLDSRPLSVAVGPIKITSP